MLGLATAAIYEAVAPSVGAKATLDTAGCADDPDAASTETNKPAGHPEATLGQLRPGNRQQKLLRQRKAGVPLTARRPDRASPGGIRAREGCCGRRPHGWSPERPPPQTPTSPERNRR